MMTATPSFSAWHALVLHRMDDGVERLIRQLERLGMRTSVQWEPMMAGEILPDIVLVDADQGWDGLLPWMPGDCPLPLVALLGSEAPGRIAWALDQGAGALIAKPIASASIYPALVLAVRAHEAAKAAETRIADLQERVRLRPLVHGAVLAIMAAHGLDETHAYRILRQAAMQRREPIQRVAASILAGNEPMPKAI
jgi:AmiR/NasT family two-component response regulator